MTAYPTRRYFWSFKKMFTVLKTNGKNSVTASGKTVLSPQLLHSNIHKHLLLLQQVAPLCCVQATWHKRGSKNMGLWILVGADQWKHWNSLPPSSCTDAAAAKSLQSCPTLCDPIDGSPPGSAVPRILQARTLEWVAISFSNAWKWKVKVKSLSRVWLLATPRTAAYQAPPSMGFSRQEYWSAIAFSTFLLRR